MKLLNSNNTTNPHAILSSHSSNELNDSIYSWLHHPNTNSNISQNTASPSGAETRRETYPAPHAESDHVVRSSASVMAPDSTTKEKIQIHNSQLTLLDNLLIAKRNVKPASDLKFERTVTSCIKKIFKHCLNFENIQLNQNEVLLDDPP